MKPIAPELGLKPLIVAKDQPQYLQLPAEYYTDPRYSSDSLITRWELSDRERKEIAAPEVAKALIQFAEWLAEMSKLPMPGEVSRDTIMSSYLEVFCRERGISLEAQPNDDARVDLYHTQLLFGGSMQPIRMFFDSRAGAVALLGTTAPTPQPVGGG